MRGYVPEYELQFKPTLNEVLATLANEPQKWKLFAGGTDLMVLLEAGKLQHRNFLDLSRFSELRKIEMMDSAIKIGALSTYTDIQNHQHIQSEFPLLARSGWVTGAKAIQNRGTIGGNIANASPAADTPPSLLAYGAQIELLSSRGTRVLEYSQFHQAYKKTQMRADEMISAVIVPREKSWTHHYYRKIGTRAFQSISKIAVSAAVSMKDGEIQKLQIGLASVAPMPIRAFDLETSLLQQTDWRKKSKEHVRKWVESLSPISDIRSTAEYRSQVLERVLLHFLNVLDQSPGIYLES